MESISSVSRITRESLRIILITCVVAFTLFWGLRGTASFLHPSLNPCHCPSSSSSSLEGPRHAVNFTKRMEFWDLSPEGDAAWASILPANGGFRQRYREDGTGWKTGISMFHQLHCLQMIRMAVQRLENGTDSAGSSGHSKGFDQRHWVHCLDYLVQAVTCAADETSEPVRNKLVDGYGVVHQCRDSARLWEWAETTLPGL